MARKIICLIGMLILPIFSIAQIQIKCGTVQQIIPEFKSDTLKTHNIHQLLVKTKILLPLKQSDSPFEIRILNYYGQRSTTIVIKCIGNNILVDRYYACSAPLDTRYKNVGEVNPGDSLYVKQVSGLKLKSPENWSLFFRELINNHFFDLPNEETINKLVLKENPKASSVIHDSAIYYEVKVGKYYRSVMYTNLFAYEADKVKFIQYQININKLFSQFY